MICFRFSIRSTRFISIVFIVVDIFVYAVLSSLLSLIVSCVYRSSILFFFRSLLLKLHFILFVFLFFHWYRLFISLVWLSRTTHYTSISCNLFEAAFFPSVLQNLWCCTDVYGKRINPLTVSHHMFMFISIFFSLKKQHNLLLSNRVSRCARIHLLLLFVYDVEQGRNVALLLACFALRK